MRSRANREIPQKHESRIVSHSDYRSSLYISLSLSLSLSLISLSALFFLSLSLSLSLSEQRDNNSQLWRNKTSLSLHRLLFRPAEIQVQLNKLECQVSLTVVFSSSALFGLLFLIFLLTIPLGNSPVLLLLRPGKTPLKTTVAKFLDTSVCGALDALTPASVHSLWSSPKFLNRFFLTILIRLRFSRLVVHLFLPHFFLPLNFLLTCLDTALCEQLLCQWMFVSYPPCEVCQWSSSGQLSDQQSSPWLCSQVNQTERPFWRLMKPLQVFWVI